jgi:hypothetical protein
MSSLYWGLSGASSSAGPWSVAGQGQVGDPHREPVALFQSQVAQEQFAVAVGLSRTATSTVCMPSGRISSATKLPLRPRARHARPSTPRVLRESPCRGLHRAASQGDVAGGDAAFAVAGSAASRVRLGRRRIDLVHHPQRLGNGLVKSPWRS